jgi:putative transposase
MKWRYINEHKDVWPVVRMCKVFDVSPSGYYGWRNRPPSQREQENEQLVKAIRKVHQDSGETYGSPRIHAELQAQGHACSLNRVARLMRRHNIQAKRRRHYKTTTNSDHDDPVAPNLLEQDFTASEPNEKWVADITYIRTDEGWLYLAVIIDLFSRLVVGWAMDTRLYSNLVERALHMAVSRRKPGQGLIHHSDQGSQYASQSFQNMLKQHHIQASMSGTGNCYDNAPAESFFASLKAERVSHRLYRTRREAIIDIFQYIETFTNRQRRHSSLGYLSPRTFEQQQPSGS